MLCTNPMPKLRCGAVRDSNHIQLFAVKDTDTDTDLYWSFLNGFLSININGLKNKAKIKEYKTIVTAKYIYIWLKNKIIGIWDPVLTTLSP